MLITATKQKNEKRSHVAKEEFSTKNGALTGCLREVY
jgi:hypothetical protein